MGLEAVKEEVIRVAKEQETALTADARKEASRIMREAERKIEEMKEKSDAETKRMMDAIKRQELAAAELENKKMLLESKKQVIDNVFAEARKRLESTDDRKREEYAKKLIEKAKKEIDAAYAYCNKRDAKFLKGVNIGAVNVIGGLIAENKERTIRVDYSFETMLEGIKDSELQNINKLLFS